MGNARIKTLPTVITWGLLALLGGSVIVSSIKDSNIAFCLIGSVGFVVFLLLFIFYFKMLGTTYVNNNEIINEGIFRKANNSINENLKIKFGIYATTIINENKFLLNKEDDKNDVMANIYNYIQNNLPDKSIVFPYIYKRDNNILNIIYLVLSLICGFIYFAIYHNILLLFLAIVLLAVSILTFLPDRKITVDKENITIYNLFNQKIIIPNKEVTRTELCIVDRKLVLYMHHDNKKRFVKRFITLNTKTDKTGIEQLFLLGKYFNLFLPQ